MNLYVPEANKIAMFMNNLKVDKIDENMLNDISSMDMGPVYGQVRIGYNGQSEDKGEASKHTVSGNGYTCVKISSFEEANKYAPYCKWYISHTKPNGINIPIIMEDYFISF